MCDGARGWAINWNASANLVSDMNSLTLSVLSHTFRGTPLFFLFCRNHSWGGVWLTTIPWLYSTQHRWNLNQNLPLLVKFGGHAVYKWSALFNLPYSMCAPWNCTQSTHGSSMGWKEQDLVSAYSEYQLQGGNDGRETYLSCLWTC